MKASPLTQVKDRFGSKEQLIDAVRALASDDIFLDRVNEDKGLDRVSNKKLLHLHAVLTDVKERFGTREALITAICDLENRKDAGYKDRLERWPTPRLWDWHRSVERNA